jgi:hypothetical protein
MKHFTNKQSFLVIQTSAKNPSNASSPAKDIVVTCGHLSFAHRVSLFVCWWLWRWFWRGFRGRFRSGFRGRIRGRFVLETKRNALLVRQQGKLNASCTQSTPLPVGSGVGGSVGGSVGFGDGSSVGDSVGAGVGSGVGASVGSSVITSSNDTQSCWREKSLHSVKLLTAMRAARANEHIKETLTGGGSL